MANHSCSPCIDMYSQLWFDQCNDDISLCMYVCMYVNVCMYVCMYVCNLMFVCYVCMSCLYVMYVFMQFLKYFEKELQCIPLWFSTSRSVPPPPQYQHHRCSLHPHVRPFQAYVARPCSLEHATTFIYPLPSQIRRAFIPSFLSF